MLLNICVTLALIPLGTLSVRSFRWFQRWIQSSANVEQKNNRWLTVVAPTLALWGQIALYRSACYIWPLAGGLAFACGARLSVVGITGGIASGKSTASKYVSTAHHWIVLDADDISRKVVMRGTSGYREIVDSFGPGVVNPQSLELDRAALGDVVFKDVAKKRDLERIIHPRVFMHMVWQIVLYRLVYWRSVAIDVPLLLESKVPIFYYMCKDIILIDAAVDTQVMRIKQRNPDMTEAGIWERIRSQMPREQKRALADIIIDNDSNDLPKLYKQLDAYFI